MFIEFPDIDNPAIRLAMTSALRNLSILFVCDCHPQRLLVLPSFLDVPS
jgi:hypothetical protein